MKTQKVWSIISILVILGLAIYLFMGHNQVSVMNAGYTNSAHGFAIADPNIKNYSVKEGTTANDGGIYLGKNNNYAFTQTESESLNPDTQAFNKNIPTLLKSFSTFDLK